MNRIQQISRELRTERLARDLGLGNAVQSDPEALRERWWRRLQALRLRGEGGAAPAKGLREERSSFRFHSME